MSRENDNRWRELFLGYEELDAETRREVDAYLARHPAAREQLAKLQALERRAMEDMGAIGLDTDGLTTPGGKQVEEERRSRQALRDRLGLEATAPTQRRAQRARPTRWLRRGWLPAAAAAAVLLYFLGPFDGARAPRLHDLHAVAVDDGRQTRSVSRTAIFRSGETVALSFALEDAASVLVYHIDPDGEVSLLVPPSPLETAPRYGPGTVQIPDDSAPEQWVLGARPGPESFVLGLSAGNAPELQSLDASLRARLATTTDRTSIDTALQSFLQERLDAVHVLEVDHQP